MLVSSSSWNCHGLITDLKNPLSRSSFSTRLTDEIISQNAVVPSPKNLRPRTRIDYSDSHLNLLGTAEGKTGKAPVNKRRRFEDENFEPTQVTWSYTVTMFVSRISGNESQ